MVTTIGSSRDGVKKNTLTSGISREMAELSAGKAIWGKILLFPLRSPLSFSLEKS